eukprot:12885447-Prorocentrum_lima.AAC.1
MLLEMWVRQVPTVEGIKGPADDTLTPLLYKGGIISMSGARRFRLQSPGDRSAQAPTSNP